MSGDPYVNLYTSDFLAGTSGMTAATKGVYITLLCLMYEAEAPLQQSWATLARRCGCTLPAFNRAISDLQDDGKVTVSDAGIWSEKCDKHIARRRERQSSAKAAADKRWEKAQENQRPPDANATRGTCQPEPEPEYRDTVVSLRREPAPSKRAGKRAIPENWVPDVPKAQGLMAELDLTRDEMNYCYQQMKGHANATDRRLANWDQGFAMWVRKAVKDGDVGPGSRSRRKSVGASAFDF